MPVCGIITRSLRDKPPGVLKFGPGLIG